MTLCVVSGPTREETRAVAHVLARVRPAGPEVGDNGILFHRHESSRRSLAASPEEESVEWAPESDAVSAASAVRASIGFDQLRKVEDALYWLESRPSSGSGPTLVRWSADDGVATSLHRVSP